MDEVDEDWNTEPGSDWLLSPSESGFYIETNSGLLTPPQIPFSLPQSSYFWTGVMFQVFWTLTEVLKISKIPESLIGSQLYSASRPHTCPCHCLSCGNASFMSVSSTDCLNKCSATCSPLTSERLLPYTVCLVNHT